VNQGGGFQGLARFFLGQAPGRQFAQLVIDQRQELLGGVLIALLDSRQNAGDFSHGLPETDRVQEILIGGELKV
jgi:hypothetical protein